MVVITPHPDDDIIGCGGVLAALRGHDNHVVTIFLTSGEVGTEDSALTSEQLRNIRQREAARAYERLGFADARLIWLGYPEFDLDFADYREIEATLVRLLREIRPDVVFALDPGATYFRYHYHDHRTAAVLSADAIAGAALPLYHREAGKAYHVPEVFLFYTAEPNMTVDVGPVLSIKVEALKEYRSQFSPNHQHYAPGTDLPATDEVQGFIARYTRDATSEPFRRRAATPERLVAGK